MTAASRWPRLLDGRSPPRWPRLLAEGLPHWSLQPPAPRSAHSHLPGADDRTRF